MSTAKRMTGCSSARPIASLPLTSVPPTNSVRPSKNGTGSTSAFGTSRACIPAPSPLVVNQALFVLLAYTLVQAHLVLRQRRALTGGTWPRTWQLLAPSMDVVAVYYRQRFCLLTLAEFSRVLLDIAEPARNTLRDKLKRIEREQYSLLENARSP